MKLVTLIENTTSRQDLAAEHGLSFYIEALGMKILFDAGSTGAFADNAETLGVDLEPVDLAFLSHGHYDHGGGLLRFLEVNSRAKIYASPWALEEHRNNVGRDIGLPKTLMSNPRFVMREAPFTLSKGLFAATVTTSPSDTSGQTVVRNGEMLPEDFRHEQYLLIEEQGKRILISGCSHKGILPIARAFRPHVLIGGFHFMKITDEAHLAAQAEALQALPTTYYTCHCTGQSQYKSLKKILGNQLHSLQTGDILEL